MTAAVATPSTTERPSRAGHALAGFGTLLRFNLRRDRIRLPVWILGVTIAVVSTAAAYPGIYPTADDRAGALLTVNNPGTTALIGPVYGGEDYTYGVMVGHELLVLTAVVAALMSIFTVVRHTRAEEESGRAELVRSSVVGRHAAAAAAVVIVVGANVVLGVALAVGLGSLGVETVDWSGSLVFGAAVAAVGLVFAGVAAVTAQLTESARSASSSAGLVLALAYVLRAIGDVSDNGLSWLSPLGWVQASEPYHADDWAPLGLGLVAAVVLMAGAVWAGRRRDVGSGVFGTRPGPARAGAGLHGPFGLAWRLGRGSLIGWAIAMLAFGLMYGPVLSEASDFLEDLPIMEEFLPDIGDATGAELFGGTIIAVVSILCAVPALQIVLRLRSEETAGRAGPLLATRLSRVRWVGASLVLALTGGAAVLAVAGLGIGVGAGLSMNDAGWIGASVIAALSYLPATAVIVGLGALLFGIAPRASAAAWALVVFAAIVMYLGGLLDFPQWLTNASPYSHVPQQPAADFAGVPLLWLTLLAGALSTVGLLGVRRRDIQDS